MNRATRGVIVGTVGWTVLGLAGCQDNEANVSGKGVTPPSAVSTSEDATKIKPADGNTGAPKGYPSQGKYRAKGSSPPGK